MVTMWGGGGGGGGEVGVNARFYLADLPRRTPMRWKLEIPCDLRIGDDSLLSELW